MKIRKFNEKGLEKFQTYIASFKTESPHSFPDNLLQSKDYTITTDVDVSLLDEIDLSNKLSAAKTLDAIVKSLKLASAEREKGLWGWCSAYLFDRLCKRDSNGKYQPGDLPKWVPEPSNWLRYYRHYLASIWRVYSAHRENEESLNVLLSGDVNTPGELFEQIAAYQEFVTNPTIINAIYKLFWDKAHSRRIKGSGGKAPRRFVAVLKQFERTYDLSTMSDDKLIELLPDEFNKFKPQHPESSRSLTSWVADAVTGVVGKIRSQTSTTS